jgi:hypothetical protein
MSFIGKKQLRVNCFLKGAIMALGDGAEGGEKQQRL